MWLGGDVPPLSSAVDDTSADAILDALNARREQLQVESAARRERWVTAKCHSSVRLMMDDWVRRLDLKRWPVVALGTAKGGVAVADLERGEVIARSPDNTHSPIGGNPNLNDFLYSTHDGGGTTAVVIKGDSVISSGREGGARAWRLDAESKELVDLGPLANLKGKQVTALSVDAEGRLWVGVFDGTFEGSVYMYDLLDPAPLSDQEPHVVKLIAPLDGINAIPNVLVIGMTNRRELLDYALLRPCRLEVQVKIPLPDRLFNNYSSQLIDTKYSYPY